MHWSGPAVYYDGQGARERTVDCTITAAGVTLRGLDVEVRLVPDAVHASLQGMNDDVRLDLAAPPGGTVIVRSREAARVLRRTGQLVSPSRRRRLGSPITLGILLLVGAGLVFTFVRGLDLLAGVAVRFVPADVETALGRRVLQAYMLEHLRVDDPRTLSILDKCAEEMAAWGDDAAVPLEIALVADPTPNAFALPGGGIVLFTGLLEVMEDEGEFFGVLAHELGHVRLRHGLRRVARTAWLGFFVSAVLGDVSGLAAILLDNSALLVSLSYDRKEERAADEFALRVLRQEGLGAAGLLTLFERLETQSRGTSIPAFLSTHPPTAERRERLRRAPEPAGRGRTLLSVEEWNHLRQRGE